MFFFSKSGLGVWPARGEGIPSVGGRAGPPAPFWEACPLHPERGEDKGGRMRFCCPWGRCVPWGVQQRAHLRNSVRGDRPTPGSLPFALRLFPSSLAPPHCFFLHPHPHSPMCGSFLPEEAAGAAGAAGVVVPSPAESVHPKAEPPSG